MDTPEKPKRRWWWAFPVAAPLLSAAVSRAVFHLDSALADGLPPVPLLMSVPLGAIVATIGAAVGGILLGDTRGTKVSGALICGALGFGLYVVAWFAIALVIPNRGFRPIV